MLFSEVSLKSVTRKCSVFIVMLTVSMLALAEGNGIPNPASDIERVTINLLKVQAKSLSASIPNSQWEVDVSLPASVSKLAPCTVPLSVDGSRVSNAGRQRVKVSCEGFRPWSLYVNGEILIQAPVLVVKNTAAPGTVIASSNVALEMRNLAKLRRGYITDIRYLEGKNLRRRVRPGDVLNDTLFERTFAVRKGNRVQIRSGTGGLSVTASGTVMDDGAIGDSVRVRNNSSGKVLYGQVQQNSVVTVGL
ncbi:flagellar basal body P-ring formation chaperone FlgA [Parendozoicomonas sp. Alg238-R29]|uniref:flagellar basal body P-ring formation chaperone FlgA n=1 Tax=Parendozoicomonas sp. Alg238-R29 TaxID=2993446 RepID=UPI00248DF1B8|nr:flagellar basal body P-ring formation chaperone FlgA [Parendozoicomonas sp. Alg238-R29]